MEQFTSIIKSWYFKNRRELPWRKNQDPYSIWLSEIILQQTRIAQGLKYYRRIIERFPDVHSLARASIDEVLKLWQGLGYYSRARNLHKAANTIINEYHGVFPDNYTELIKLQGVGDYTAAAILSISFRKPYPVVDGNVIRVLSRVFGINVPYDKAIGRKKISALASKYLDTSDPGNYNQAIMEFGATYCIPKNPKCPDCVLNRLCYAYKNKAVHDLPLKSAKIIQKKRYLNYLVVLENGNTFLKARREKDIWRGLYDFPLIETQHAVELKQLTSTTEWGIWFAGGPFKHIRSYPIVKHQLTHQVLFVRFVVLAVTTSEKLISKGFQKVHLEDVNRFPVPVVIGQFIEHLKKKCL